MVRDRGRDSLLEIIGWGGVRKEDETVVTRKKGSVNDKYLDVHDNLFFCREEEEEES